jgi:mutual gliding-motility protein MglA
LRENLKSNGMNVSHLPLVIQFNKRDLPAVRSDKELADLASRGKEPVFPAVATTGQGVLETFIGLSRLTYSTLDSKHKLSEKFGIDRGKLLDDIARRLGAKTSVERLLGECLGGVLDAHVPKGEPL